MTSSNKQEEVIQHPLVGKLVRGKKLYTFVVKDDKLSVVLGDSPVNHVVSRGKNLLHCASFIVLRVEELHETTLFKSNFPNAFMLKVLTVPEGVVGWIECCDPAWLEEITEEDEET